MALSQPPMPLSFPLLGALSFLAFVIFAVLRRVGRDPSPYRALAKLHLRFAGVYIGVAALEGWLHRDQPFPWPEAFLGLYLYFALEYAFFAHVFATIIRGFSINICVAIHRLGGSASLSDIRRTYADGKGIDYVKNERIEVLIESGAVSFEGGKLRLSPFGKGIAVLNRWILKIWGLGYLGK